MANLHYTPNMTKKRLFSFLALVVISTSVFGQKLDMSLWNSGINYNRYSDHNSELIQEGIEPTAVLMGDSITDVWINNHPEFFEENNLVDRGIGGETTGQMLLRFREDVINLNPKVVAILAGINDIAENTGPIEIEKVFGNITCMAELALANDIKVVLCKLVPSNRFPWRERIVPTEKVLVLNQMIEDYANDNRIVLVDYFTPMKDDNRGLRSDLGSDGVHPNTKGYQIMEPLLLEGIHKALNEN
jgi:lysophospholipase L1-like esterase